MIEFRLFPSFLYFGSLNVLHVPLILPQTASSPSAQSIRVREVAVKVSLLHLMRRKIKSQHRLSRS